MVRRLLTHHASRFTLRHTVIGDSSYDLSRSARLQITNTRESRSSSCSRQRAKPRHESVLTHEFELWSAAWSWLKGLSWLTSIDSRWWSLCVYWLKTHESIHGRHTTPQRIFSGSFQVKSTFWDARAEQLSKIFCDAQPREVMSRRAQKFFQLLWHAKLRCKKMFVKKA